MPHRAKSAATLIAVGADKVVMSHYGELGPLDTQIADPRNPAALVSALDCYQSVDYVRDFGIESLSRALKVMLGQTQGSIPFSQVMDLATSFAAANVKPMLGQVRALDFGGWGRTLKIGEAYAKALRLRLDEPKPEAEAVKVAKKLVYGYPHHPYPIDTAEARKLGLDVVDMPDDIYKAAKAVADSCKQDARFVGFAATAREAIENFGEKKNREIPAIPRQGVREPVAHEYPPRERQPMSTAGPELVHGEAAPPPLDDDGIAWARTKCQILYWQVTRGPFVVGCSSSEGTSDLELYLISG